MTTTKIIQLQPTGQRHTEKEKAIEAYMNWCVDTPQFRGAVKEACCDLLCYGKTLKTPDQYLVDHKDDKDYTIATNRKGKKIIVQ